MTDGNVYSIIGRVRRALIEAGKDERAREFVEKAYRSGSYEGGPGALLGVRGGRVKRLRP